MTLTDLTNTSALLTLHDDRLLPSERRTRDIARGLYRAVRDHPIISPHGHVDPNLLPADEAFADPTSLMAQHDHYVTRMLHAASFGITERPSAENAERLYDEIAFRLAEPELRPRALLTQFGIDVLATTDDPSDGLLTHQAIAADPTFPTKVIPTFRPDRYLEPYADGWNTEVNRLGAAAGVEVGHYDQYIGGNNGHDMSRRLDAGFLAGLVAEHRLDPDEALDSLVQLVVDQPGRVFKL